MSRASLRREIVAKVKVAAASRSGRRGPSPAIATPRGTPRGSPLGTLRLPVRVAPPKDTAGVAILGASTGGPRAISDLLGQLPADFATPCVVVQHLPATFTQPFAAQLSRHTALRVAVAETGDPIEAGVILVAPGALHLVVRSDGRVQLLTPGAKDIYRPSINLAMASAADAFGAAAIGVILTGSGDDGADGLKRIRDAGGGGFIQDPPSCIAPSMPARALDRAGADHVASPERIGQMLALRRTS